MVNLSLKVFEAQVSDDEFDWLQALQTVQLFQYNPHMLVELEKYICTSACVYCEVLVSFVAVEPIPIIIDDVGLVNIHSIVLFCPLVQDNDSNLTQEDQGLDQLKYIPLESLLILIHDLYLISFQAQFQSVKESHQSLKSFHVDGGSTVSWATQFHAHKVFEIDPFVKTKSYTHVQEAEVTFISKFVGQLIIVELIVPGHPGIDTVVVGTKFNPVILKFLAEETLTDLFQLNIYGIELAETEPVKLITTPVQELATEIFQVQVTFDWSSLV